MGGMQTWTSPLTPKHVSGLPRTSEISNFVCEWGRRGSVWAHIESGRGRELQEVSRYLLDLRDAIQNSKINQATEDPTTQLFSVYFPIWGRRQEAPAWEIKQSASLGVHL